MEVTFKEGREEPCATDGGQAMAQCECCVWVVTSSRSSWSRVLVQWEVLRGTRLQDREGTRFGARESLGKAAQAVFGDH